MLRRSCLDFRSISTVSTLLLCSWAAMVGQPRAQQDEPQVAIDGLDPVLLHEGKQVAGLEQLTLDHQQFRYRFASEATRQQFSQRPARFAYAFEGQCAVMPGVRASGSIWTVHDGLLIGFGSPGCRERFLADPAAFMGQAKPRVAVLVFEGVQTIDFSAPIEVFAQAGFEVFTTATQTTPITTAAGLMIVPRYALAQAPVPDIVVIPGGGIDTVREDRDVRRWLDRHRAGGSLLLSVCNGVFLLAREGWLDGQRATTFYGLQEQLKKERPQLTIDPTARFVDLDNIVVTAGLSSGIDGSLHVVERFKGRGFAQRLALNLEYQWDPDGGWARAALADLPLRELLGRAVEPTTSQLGNWKLLATAGSRQRWMARWQIHARGGEALNRDLSELTSSLGWRRLESSTDSSIQFEATDQHGRVWQVSFTTAVGPEPETLLLTAEVDPRAGRQ